MASKNDVTGDSIQTKVTSESYRSNYDKIFGKKKETEKEKQERRVREDITLFDLTNST